MGSLKRKEVLKEIHKTYLVSTVVPRDFLAEDENGLVSQHLFFHGDIKSVADGHLKTRQHQYVSTPAL